MTCTVIGVVAVTKEFVTVAVAAVAAANVDVNVRIPLTLIRPTKSLQWRFVAFRPHDIEQQITHFVLGIYMAVPLVHEGERKKTVLEHLVGHYSIWEVDGERESRTPLDVKEMSTILKYLRDLPRLPGW